MRDPGHDWTRCPFAHRGERARRRHPSLYCGETCVNYKKGYCKNGLTCEFAHGWFESWLHPHRYRTKHCKHGVNCNRRVCFFAHGDEEIRFPPTLSSSKMKDHKNYSSTHNRSLSTNVVTPQIYNATRQDVVSSPRGVHAAQSSFCSLANLLAQHRLIDVLCCWKNCFFLTSSMMLIQCSKSFSSRKSRNLSILKFPGWHKWICSCNRHGDC